jgi:hypothetical protein
VATRWAFRRIARADRYASRRAAAPALAVLLALVAVLTAPSARTATAASSPLLFDGSTTYTVDPDSSAIHVTVDLKITDRKRNDALHIYYFDHLAFRTQPEATKLKLSDAGGPLKFTTKREASTKKGGIRYFPDLLISFKLRHLLFYGQTVKIRLTYDLAGLSRSASPMRAGQAFASFAVWPFGDDGHIKVKVIVPKGFEVRTEYSTLTKSTTADGQTVLSAAPATSLYWWSLITAEREASYAVSTLQLATDLEVRMESFPEDTEWAEQVGDTLRRATPVLLDLIRLSRRGAGTLVVRERFVLDLGGVATTGLEPGKEWSVDPTVSPDEIALTESLDELEIMSQFASAWFGAEPFRGRWISDGLAREYAARALDALGTTPPGPEKPKSDEAGHQPLELWSFPGFSRGTYYDSAKRVAQAERYGHNAAWYVIHQLVEDVGTDRMRDVLQRAANDQVAYTGAGAPEDATSAEDWRRLLDLLEEVGGATDAEPLFREFVLTTLQTARLDERAAARNAYHALVASGNGWLPPIYVRAPMEGWLFEEAQSSIDEARSVLDLRATVEAQAAQLSLTAGPAMKAAYENATDGFDGATGIGQAEGGALGAMAEARKSLDAERDLVTSVGLIGERPEDDYARAATAFEKDDPAAALDAARATTAALGQAPEVGRTRLLIAAAVVAGMFLVLIALVAFVLRRRRRRTPEQQPPS